jgi:penicillin-binding protein 1A
VAEGSVAGILPDTGGQFQAALVSIESTTGAVRALVGGPDFATTKFDLATQGGRQAGSAFKPFTLTAALEAGFSPNDSILGAGPCTIPNPGSREPWTPANVEGEAPGVLSLTDATVHSVNCAYARLVSIIGPDKVVDAAKRMGITSPLHPFLSVTLGVESVSPLEMASAYATLAADGQRHAPYFVDEVDDAQGRVLIKAEPKGEQVVDPRIARMATSVLAQVIQRGTGRAAGFPGWPMAGKTGTTDLHTNAWFVGYTPTLSTAVWMGAPHADVPMYNVGGITVFGGTYPARIWHDYMAAALEGPPVGFPPSDPPPPGQYRAAPGDPAPAPEPRLRQAEVPSPAAPFTEPPQVVPDAIERLLPGLYDTLVPDPRRRPRSPVAPG